MDDLITRFIENLGIRLDGPMKFRLYLQPVMSLIYAIIAGVRDAKSGSVPYFKGLIFSKGERKDLVKEGWKDIWKVFLLAIIMEVIFQLIVFKTVHVFEAIRVSIFLAIIPYIIFRGPVNRIVSFFIKKK